MSLARFFLRLALPFGLLGLACVASAQQAPAGPLHPRPGAPVEKAPVPKVLEPPAQIRVHVNVVSLPVTVHNPQGELALTLSERDFRVYDNGIAQQLSHFSLGGGPLDVVLLAETSSRIEPLLPAVRRTGIIFTQVVMGQTGEAAVIGFDDDIRVLVPFTANHDQVEKAIEKLPEGTSGARLYDALARGVSLLEGQPTNRRRVILVLSEATDTGSEDKLGAVLREAQLANVTIYTIGLSTTAAELRAKPGQAGPPEIGPPGTFPMPGPPGVPQTPTTQQQAQGNINLLPLIAWLVEHAANTQATRSLALASTATGGRHISTFRDRSIETAMDEIGGELHAQYLLAYRPMGSDVYGYHEIRVEVSRPGYKVRARPGYYLAPPTS
jgi:VWFA-related protein